MARKIQKDSLYELRKKIAMLTYIPIKPGELNNILESIAKVASDAFSVDICTIMAFNPITGKTMDSFMLGDRSQKKQTVWLQMDLEGFTQPILDKGLFIIEDLQEEPQYYNDFMREERIRSFVGIALYTRYHQKPLGVIHLNFKQRQKSSPDNCEAFRIFAMQAATLLQEMWLAYHYEEVAHIGQLVNQNLSEAHNLFEELESYVASVFDESHTLLLAVYQSQSNQLDMYTQENGASFSVNASLAEICKHVLSTQKALFISHFSKECAQLPLPFQAIQVSDVREKESLIFLPLTIRGAPLGVLSIQHSLPNVYSQEDLFALQLLASYIALALHNMRLYNNLTQLNETGQILTRQLESEQTLSAIVEKIREATKADVVILYLYDSAIQRFILPPHVAGVLYSSPPQAMSPERLNDVAVISLHHTGPIFAEKSDSLYTTLEGKVRLRQENFQQREKIRSTVVEPLRVGDKSVGVLFLNFRQPQQFMAPQMKLIDGLAHYAAIAIENAQKYSTLIQRRMRELEILRDIDRKLSQSLDLKSVLSTLLEQASRYVPAEEASILLYNPRLQALETVEATGRSAEKSRTQILSLQETRGITRWVMDNKTPARVDNVKEELPWRYLHFPVAEDITSELDVPLLEGENVVGVLNFESTREAAFHKEDQDFLVTLSGQAVLAIKNAQAFEREKRLVEEARVLREISKEITSQLELSSIFDLILEKALKLTHSASGTLMLPDPADPRQNSLLMAAERGVATEKKGKSQKFGEGVVGYVAAHKKMLNVDPSQPPWNEIYLDFFPKTRSELAVPLLAGSELYGVLNIESPELHNFSESDERLLQGLSDLAIVALQNAQAYEQEKRLTAEHQVLNEISKEITSQLDHIHVFELILESALKLTHSHMGNLMLYDPVQDHLWMAAERGVAPEKKGKSQKLGEGIVGSVAASKQLLNIGDVSQPPWKEVFLEYILQTRSELAVPLLVGNELRGVLNIESPTPHNFNESDKRLLQGLAGLAVVALQNAQAYEQERRLATERQVLNEISKEITSQFDHIHVFELILEGALKLTNSTLGSLHLYDPVQERLLMVAERGVAPEKKGKSQKPGEGIVGYVAANKQLLNIGDVSQAPWDSIFTEFFPGTCSELAVPMFAGSDLRGVLNVENSSRNHFDKNNEDLLQELADLAVIALQNAERYEKAEREAQHFKLLFQAAQELSRVSNFSQLDRAYGIIVRIAAQQSGSQAVIYRYNEENAVLELVCASQQTPPLFTQIARDEGLNGQVAREHKTLVVNDIDRLPANVSPIKKSDADMRSFIVTPLLFEDQYYGNLGVRHKDIHHFLDTDINFFDALAQQLANAIYRLDTTRARQEFEQRALSAEEMSSIGQTAFEVTHRLGNDLGLVESYIVDVHAELARLGTSSDVLSRKLGNIKKSVQSVLSFSSDIKKKMAKLGTIEEKPSLVPPRDLLEEAALIPMRPTHLCICVEIDDDVAPVMIMRSSVADILRNLVTNAVQAMPEGGALTLRGRNIGLSVAIDVIDTGVGIPEQRLTQIFDLFFSTKGSSGFGLWSARRNALRNHGDLKVHSKQGKGTTFTLLLPKATRDLL